MAKVRDLHLEKHKQEVLQNTNSSPPEKEKTNKNLFDSSDKEQENDPTFSQLIRKSHEVLIRLHTVFPFDIFPDTLTVDPIKINYRCNILFTSGYTESIPIPNITDVVVESSILFSALRISFTNYPTTQLVIKPLWKKDAERARDIITGLVEIEKKQLDLIHTPLTNPHTLEKLGEVH